MGIFAMVYICDILFLNDSVLLILVKWSRIHQVSQVKLIPRRLTPQMLIMFVDVFSLFYLFEGELTSN